MSNGQAMGLLVLVLLVVAGIALLRRRRRRGGGARRFSGHGRVRTWSKSDKWSPWR